MRVVRGKFGGRRITVPKGIDARPTTDFAKESLFNILENNFEIQDSKVLDLYTGTGNISIEFASRGAASIIAVDVGFPQINFIKKQSEEWGLPILVYRQDAIRYIGSCKQKFDFIFADPPYNNKNVTRLPDLIFDNELLTPDGVLVVEHGKENDLSNLRNFIEVRCYSRVHFSFFAVKSYK